MKRITLTALLAALLVSLAAVAYADNPPLPKIGTPVLITALGQSQDANFVNLLAKRKKLNTQYDLHIFAADVNWNEIKSLFVVLGGSGKGLGAAGLDIPGEVQRSDDLIKAAKEHGVHVTALHIGGEDRRGPNSDPFLHYAGMSDFAIVRSDGNADGFFTKLCGEKNVPMYTIEKTSELTNILVEMCQ